MTTRYHLEIYGRVWQGFKACHQYTLTEQRALELSIDSVGINRDAGDFAEVIDYRVVKETCEYSAPKAGVSVRTDTFETLRGFRNGMTPARFHRMINR